MSAKLSHIGASVPATTSVPLNSFGRPYVDCSVTLGQSASSTTRTWAGGLKPSRSARYSYESAAMCPIASARFSTPALANVGSPPGTSTRPFRRSMFTGVILLVGRPPLDPIVQRWQIAPPAVPRVGYRAGEMTLRGTDDRPLIHPITGE